MLTQEDIEHIAELARLEIEDDELETYRNQLGSILEYVATLQTVNTDGVLELAHGDGLVNVWREDVAQTCDADERARVIAAFPRRAGDLLEVPGVFEEKKG
jgi:aspartyl-tRNA(Asn)/glutamyl-tRNA(Gln) amidotransferase subunit C